MTDTILSAYQPFYTPPTESALREIVKYECAKINISPQIVSAIITTESHWNPYAVRYEQNYDYTTNVKAFANRNNISLESEKTLQKTSWGLGQLMGGTIRTLDYSGPLTAAIDHELNIKLMCKFYARLSSVYKTDKERIAAYNAGSPRYKADGTFVNQEYVDKVMKAL